MTDVMRVTTEVTLTVPGLRVHVVPDGLLVFVEDTAVRVGVTDVPGTGVVYRFGTPTVLPVTKEAR